MPYIAASFLLLVIGLVAGSGLPAILLLAASQLALVLRFAKEKTVTGLGSFTFMYFLFFGMRAIYMTVEQDYVLFSTPLRISVTPEMIASALWWGSAALLTFVLGGLAGRRWASDRLRGKRASTAPLDISGSKIPLLLAAQVMAAGLGVLLHPSAGYASEAGAYAYDLPVVFQGVHLFCALVIADRFLKKKTASNLLPLVLSVALLLFSTYMIRKFSLYRGSYITGLIIFGLGSLMHWKKRVPYYWLILPILFLLPLFHLLGEKRTVDVGELGGVVVEQASETFSLRSYWDFYNHKGDMNIFDTFVAAKESTPKMRNHVWVWFYTFVHWVPRKLWDGKPKQGKLQDLDFTHGAPYQPSIAGLYLLDGGYAWMLFSMALLGAIIAALDIYALLRLDGYLRICLYAGLVANALYLPRFCMWQYFYQVLYFAVPCFLLTKFLESGTRNTPRRAQPLIDQNPQTSEA